MYYRIIHQSLYNFIHKCHPKNFYIHMYFFLDALGNQGYVDYKERKKGCLVKEVIILSKQPIPSRKEIHIQDSLCAHDHIPNVILKLCDMRQHAYVLQCTCTTGLLSPRRPLCIGERMKRSSFLSITKGCSLYDTKFDNNFLWKKHQVRPCHWHMNSLQEQESALSQS